MNTLEMETYSEPNWDLADDFKTELKEAAKKKIDLEDDEYWRDLGDFVW